MSSIEESRQYMKSVIKALDIEAKIKEDKKAGVVTIKPYPNYVFGNWIIYFSKKDSKKVCKIIEDALKESINFKITKSRDTCIVVAPKKQVKRKILVGYELDTELLMTEIKKYFL